MAELALEDNAAVTRVTLFSMQLLVEDGVGSKCMTGAIRLDSSDVQKAKVVLGQAPSV